MKQWTLHISLILMVFFVLGACNDNALEDYEAELNKDVSNPVLEEDEEKAGELILRHLFTEGDNDSFIGMIESVEEKSDVSIELNTQGWEGYEAILRDEMSRQELPHIIELRNPDPSFVYEESENLLDLTDFLEEKGMMEQFHSLDSFTVDGKIYGLPFRGWTDQLFYNIELLEELGGVPETLEELMDRIVEANRAGYTPIVLDEYGSDILTLFEGVLQQTIGADKISDLINGSANWTDDEFVHAFELLEELSQLDIPYLETALLGDPLELAEAFLTEDIVFFYTGDFLPSIQSSDEFSHTEGNIGVVPMPPMSVAQDDQYSIHGSFDDGFVFSADVTEKEEKMIYQFIETLWSDEYMLDYNVEFGHIPAIRVESATKDDLFQKIIQINNQSTGTFPGLGSVLSYHYYDEIMNVLIELMDGNISAYEAAELLQENHETSADKVF